MEKILFLGFEMNQEMTDVDFTKLVERVNKLELEHDTFMDIYFRVMDKGVTHNPPTLQESIILKLDDVDPVKLINGELEIYKKNLEILKSRSKNYSKAIEELKHPIN